MMLGSGATPYFVVALVVFEDHEEATACDQRIGLLRRELSLPGDFEFHFHDDHPTLRKIFLTAVAPPTTSSISGSLWIKRCCLDQGFASGIRPTSTPHGLCLRTLSRICAMPSSSLMRAAALPSGCNLLGTFAVKSITLDNPGSLRRSRCNPRRRIICFSLWRWWRGRWGVPVWRAAVLGGPGDGASAWRRSDGLAGVCGARVASDAGSGVAARPTVGRGDRVEADGAQAETGAVVAPAQGSRRPDPRQIWEGVGVSKQGAMNLLRPLLEAGPVRRIGTRKSGRYVLV